MPRSEQEQHISFNLAIQVRSGICQGSELILLAHFLIWTCSPDVTSPGDLVVQVPLPGPVIDFQLLANRQRGLS